MCWEILISDFAIARFGRSDCSLRMSVSSVRDARTIRPKLTYAPFETSTRSIRNEHTRRPKLAIAPSATGVRKVDTSWLYASWSLTLRYA